MWHMEIAREPCMYLMHCVHVVTYGSSAILLPDLPRLRRFMLVCSLRIVVDKNDRLSCCGIKRVNIHALSRYMVHMMCVKIFFK